MGLMHFLRRQFAGADTRSGPIAAAAAAPPPPALTPRRPSVPAPQPHPANGLQPARPAAGEALLHFAERREARFATFSDPDTHREILRLHEMINQLHRQHRRLREDRDKWERLARELERELVVLRHAETGAIASPLLAADKFRRAKILLARLTHPDTSGATGVEAGIRATVFREFWTEFERIEAETPTKAARLVRH